jgi:hypothetical protein
VTLPIFISTSFCRLFLRLLPYLLCYLRLQISGFLLNFQLRCQQSQDVDVSDHRQITPIRTAVYAFDAQRLILIYGSLAIFIFFIHSRDPPFPIGEPRLRSGVLKCLRYARLREPHSDAQMLTRSLRYARDGSRRLHSMPSSTFTPNAVPFDNVILLGNASSSMLSAARASARCLIRNSVFDLHNYRKLYCSVSFSKMSHDSFGQKALAAHEALAC